MVTVKNSAQKILKFFAGIFLVIAGIIGLFLPFLQGIAMIIAGIYLLGGWNMPTKVLAFFNRMIKKMK